MMVMLDVEIKVMGWCCEDGSEYGGDGEEYKRGYDDGVVMMVVMMILKMMMVLLAKWSPE